LEYRVSENLNIHASLTAADHMSPVIRGIIKNLNALNPQGGSSSPNGNIHVNRHNGDPQTLANKVQKRIDENLRRRTHDAEMDNV